MIRVKQLLRTPPATKPGVKHLLTTICQSRPETGGQNSAPFSCIHMHEKGAEAPRGALWSTGGALGVRQGPNLSLAVRPSRWAHHFPPA